MSNVKENLIHEQQRRDKNIYTLWKDIQDIVGPANEWPKIIRKCFWSKIDHKMRPVVAAFVYINGLNPVVPISIEFFQLLGVNVHSFGLISRIMI